MTYTLFENPRSGSCIVECALAEIGVACELRNIDLKAGAQHGGAYTVVNPQRKSLRLLSRAAKRLPSQPRSR